jgi:hypothetical protein
MTNENDPISYLNLVGPPPPKTRINPKKTQERNARSLPLESSCGLPLTDSQKQNIPTRTRKSPIKISFKFIFIYPFLSGAAINLALPAWGSIVGSTDLNGDKLELFGSGVAAEDLNVG